jgi:uncharacterized membrane protein
MNKNTKQERVIKSFFEALRLNISVLPLTKLLANHPNPNSLAAIGDILNETRIKNVTLLFSEHEKNKLLELPTPFISQTIEGGFVVVKKMTDSIVEYYSSILGNIKEDWSIFNTQCTGVALLAFPDEKSGEKIFPAQNKQVTLEKTAFRLIGIGLMVSIIGFLIILFQSSLGLQGVLLMILKLIGLSICSLLILNDFDNTDSIVNRVCSAGKSDCNKILTDKNAKFFGIINWSELGLVYFGGSLLFLFFTIEKLDFAFPILGFLSLSCVSFSFYSLWYQAFKSKEWCYFCLATLLVFWLEFAVLFPTSSWILPTDWQVYNMALLSFGGMITLAYFITSYLKKAHQFNDAKSELNYIKYDSALFNQLLESEKSYNTEGALSLSVLENEEATNSIVVVTNPLCNPCFKTHHQITDYTNGCYDNYQINLIFMIRDYSDTNSEDYKIVKRILALHRYKGQEATLQALEGWYDSDNQKTYSNWEILHPVAKEDVDDLILSQKGWCEKNTISFTPTVIVNQKQLPKYYQVSDLKYFLD